MKHYLVTGGAGFIGSHTAERIVENGGSVVILDDLSTGFLKNVQPLLARYPDRVSFIQGSITDAEAVKQACESCDYVIHLAAAVSVPWTIEHPIEANRVNIDGHLQLLVAARDCGVKRVVFASSAAVYGNDPVLPKVENMKPAPASPYAIGKITGEYYMRTFYELYGLETVSLRFFNIFGPRQNPYSQYSSVIPRFITAIVSNEQPTIYGDGQQSRDFTYISDVVSAILLACEAGGVSGQVMNIACGDSINLLTLIGAINSVCGKQIQPRFADPQPGDIKHSCADITRARDLLGYEPEIGFTEGIRKTVEWHTLVSNINNHRNNL